MLPAGCWRHPAPQGKSRAETPRSSIFQYRVIHIAKKIEAKGRDVIFACFEYTDSGGLDIDGADVRLTLDSQQDGDDWDSTARLEVYYGDGKYMELEAAETVSGDDFEADPTVLSDVERIVYGKLIDEFFALARRA